LAFTGTLKAGIGGVSSSNATGIWIVSPEGVLSTVARAGDLAPGLSGAKFASFNQIVLPDEAGIAFVATLATGSGGISSSNNIGLWAAPVSGGEPVLIVRIGDSLTVGGVVKTIASFSVFSASPNTPGAGRHFNAAGDLVFRLVFTDKSSGIFRYPAP
jgi:hypothetical protein